MKRLLEFTLRAKIYACLIFTGTMLLYIVIGWLTGWADGMSFSTIFQMLVISLLGAFIQCFAFTDAVFKHMRYSRRALLFVCLFLPALAGFAMGFRWFPVENGYSWLIFLGIFLGIFVVMTASFEIYFRIQGKRYDGLLGQYRKDRDLREKG